MSREFDLSSLTKLIEAVEWIQSNDLVLCTEGRRVYNARVLEELQNFERVKRVASGHPLTRVSVELLEQQGLDGVANIARRYAIDRSRRRWFRRRQ